MTGRWPMAQQPTDIHYYTVGNETVRVDRFGIVYVNGQIVAKTPVLVEDTRDYLETITGGK